ncbi:rod shape-determining protein MreD [Legionella sp. MW5194]|uniref:rod shape-determining protein MreD n=1 Tax=Legionella sp. MW5194 TaxID=2662448 RepID=UPI00193E0A8B|nr:rod shape-determining protein MreD [Legionella sp. MW5194]QRN03416.1 rod shape-determining protein MreD [Legionella sp. MW5194]
MNSLKWRLPIAFLIALILTIMPLPAFLVTIRPPWILLLVLYLQFYMPDYFRVSILVMLGLVLDALLATVIGEHAFALCLTTWLASSKARRFYFFPIGQQMALIGFFCAWYQLTVFFIDAFLGYTMNWMTVIGGTLLSILVWPWIRLAAEETLLVRARFKA